jgi:flagellar basal-body rod protein FlgF/flagellar basal-body rod protein FlgG
MDSGFYAACTALLARSQALDMVANNLANTSTPGYRAQHDLFRSLLASSSALPISNLNYAVNNYSVLGGSQLDLSQGTLTKTGNDLDFGIQGQGFFVVQSAAGQVFTRNGNFHVSPQGKLVTSQGDPVLGDNGRPISIVGAPVSVSADGTISVNGAVAGTLKVVDFPAGTSLESIGKTYYAAPPKSATPATQANIQQGVLESSNVNPVTSAVELVTVQRYAELMQRALSLFHTDMNQVAVQELPRISNNS